MKYGEIEGIGKPISRVVLGAMVVSSEALERSFALLDAAAQLGITTLDTAHVYAGGRHERGIGAWMCDRANREQMVIISKGAHHDERRCRVTPEDIASDLADSLERLQTEYIDLYLLHRDDPAVPVGPIVEALNMHYRAGRIHAFGGSNWTHTRLMEANAYAAEHGLQPFRASSPHFGLAEMVREPWAGCLSIAGSEHTGARAWYRQSDMPVFAYSCLGGGLFSGRFSRETFPALRETLDPACVAAYCHEVNFQRLERAQQLAAEKHVHVAQIALAYVLNTPLNLYAVVGVSSAERLRELTRACEMMLTSEEMAWLNLGERPIRIESISLTDLTLNPTQKATKHSLIE